MALQTTETQYNLYTVQKGDTLYKIAKNNDVAFPAFVLVNLAGLFLVKIIPRVVAMKEYIRYSNLVYQGCDDYFDKLLEDAGIMEDFSTKLVMDNNSNKESRTLNLSRAKRV